MKTLFTITLIVELIFAIGFLAMPNTLVGLFGVSLGDFGVVLARFFGSALLGFVVLMWFARSTDESSMQRAATATMFTYFGISTIFILIAQLGGVMNMMGWSTVGLHLILAIAFGYFLFKR